MNNSSWFRFYSDKINDRSLRRISSTSSAPAATVLGVWVTILCMASESPEPGKLKFAGFWITKRDIQQETGLDPEPFERIFGGLLKLKMITSVSGSDKYEIPEWDKKYKLPTDNGVERIKRYRQRKKRAEGSFTNEEWEQVLEYYGRKCLACGSTKDICADHVIPLMIGGSDKISNIQPLCRQCNSGKRDKHQEYRWDGGQFAKDLALHTEHATP